ncbi:MAG: HAD family hydrolase [Candidatus Odinarchaeum yellowstonii]|uniref:HAD family hydrolase n=1 Tax=Odinarchaeota yellowstonii (strain LCB_4) TaxID=1841599 RepID=A0AAF0IB86_ODILC|nr:MAG: HAD family hydrolase [Candidatus Odinarchaeum yellowstonii]
MAMVKVVSFDVDGTLATRKYADLIWEEAIPKLYAEKHGVSFEEAKSFIIKEYEKIGDQRVEWYQISYWFNRFGLTGYDELLNKYEGVITYYPEVDAVLKNLAEKFDLIIVSNSAVEFLERTTKNIRKYFRRIFSASTDFNSTKSDPGVFKKVCFELNIDSNEIAHVGDNWVQDYLIPRRVGVKSYYLDRDGVKAGRFTVKDLNDFHRRVLNLIKRLK